MTQFSVMGKVPLFTFSFAHYTQVVRLFMVIVEVLDFGVGGDRPSVIKKHLKTFQVDKWLLAIEVRFWFYPPQ